MPARARFLLLSALLLLGSAGVYLVGNASVPLWDRDEPRYAQCSREMIVGSPEHPGADYVVPRFLGRPRQAKPPLIYWLQAAAMRVPALGQTAFAARLPSAVAMLAVLAVVLAVVRRATGDAERALWTAFVLSTAALTYAAAKSSLTDAVLLLFVLTAQCCAYQMWRRRGSWPVVALFGVSLGLAGLTKGPVVLGMIGATFGALGALRLIDWWIARRAEQANDLGGQTFLSVSPPGISQEADGGRDGQECLSPEERTLAGSAPLDDSTPHPNPLSAGTRGEGTASRIVALGILLKSLLALALIAAIVGPWLYLIEKHSPGFLGVSIGRDVVGRIRSGAEGHSGPPGYYLATVWGTYFPWSLFIPMALVFAWRRRADPLVRYALAAVAGPFVMLECVQTKLPHYFLPAFPFLAFLTADALVRCFRGEHDDLVRPSFGRFIRGWGVVVAALGLSPWLLAFAFRPQPWAALAAASGVAVAYAGAVVWLFRAGRVRWGAFAMGAGMAAVAVVMFAVLLPRAEYLHLSVRVADALRANGATSPGEVVMQDYKEPSLAFYQGGTIRELRDMTIDPARVPRWLVTTRDVYAKTPDDVKARFDVVHTAKGLAIADGARAVEVIVLRKR